MNINNMNSFGFEKIGITELKKCVNCKNVIEKQQKYVINDIKITKNK